MTGLAHFALAWLALSFLLVLPQSWIKLRRYAARRPF